jgi:hypothetical protein
MDRLEGVESDDELAQRPLAVIIATILNDFGVTGLNDANGATQLIPADIAALYHCATGLVASRLAGVPAIPPVDGGEADAIRPRGATGCRDP